MPLLEVKNLKIDFYTEDGIFSAVNSVSFSLNEGETIALIGESGCGKTITALSILHLLPFTARIHPESRILFKGTDLNLNTVREYEKIRGKEISMVFQEPMTSLNPVFTIGYQLDEIFRIHFGVDKKEAHQRTIETLGKVKLPDPSALYKMYPHQLSGGMRQRVMIALAVACNPSLIIADEPTTALDVTIQSEIIKLFSEIKTAERGMIFISHNLLLVKSFADRIAIMYAGEIIEEGTSAEVFADPMHPYTKGLINAIPYIGIDKKLNEIPGTVPSLMEIPLESCRFNERCKERMTKCITGHPDLLGEGSHRVRCYLYES